jgi:hypothetical protein
MRNGGKNVRNAVCLYLVSSASSVVEWFFSMDNKVDLAEQLRRIYIAGFEMETFVLKNSKLASNVSDRVTSDELRKWLEGLNDEDLGHYKM